MILAINQFSSVQFSRMGVKRGCVQWLAAIVAGAGLLHLNRYVMRVETYNQPPDVALRPRVFSFSLDVGDLATMPPMPPQPPSQSPLLSTLQPSLPAAHAPMHAPQPPVVPPSPAAHTKLNSENIAPPGVPRVASPEGRYIAPPGVPLDMQARRLADLAVPDEALPPVTLDLKLGQWEDEAVFADRKGMYHQ